jgi:transcriptional regulator with GAF, ATPase, and Fis domain
MQHIVLDTYNLETAERRLCVEALTTAGNIVGAARLLGITRHALKRRIIKLELPWSRRAGQLLAVRPAAEMQTTLAAHPA